MNNKEVQSIIRRIERVNNGEPWFGQAVFVILDPQKGCHQTKCTQHSMLELLYPMITWADFTLKRIEKDKINDLAAAEKLDWRTLNLKIHSWKKGLRL